MFQKRREAFEKSDNIQQTSNRIDQHLPKSGPKLQLSGMFGYFLSDVSLLNQHCRWYNRAISAMIFCSENAGFAIRSENKNR